MELLAIVHKSLVQVEYIPLPANVGGHLRLVKDHVWILTACRSHKTDTLLLVHVENHIVLSQKGATHEHFIGPCKFLHC